MSVYKNMVANYVGQCWAAVASIAFIPIYIHQLGIESYALIGIFSILQAWLALLDLGLSPTLGREMARFTGSALSPRDIRNLLRTVEAICLVIAVTAALAIAGAAPFIASHWLKTDLPPTIVIDALAIMGIVVALRFCEAIYRSALCGLERQLWYNAANVVLVTLRFGGAALVLCFISPTIQAFFWWQLAVSILALGVLGIKLYTILPRIDGPAGFSATALREVRGFAGGMLGINLVALILTQSDKVVLSKALPLVTFGYYALAATMCSVIVAAVAPISQAIFPALTRHNTVGDVQAFDRTYHFAAQLVSVAGLTIASPLIFFPHEVIMVWSENRQLADNAAPLLRILAVGGLLNALMQTPYFATLALGKTGFAFAMNLVAIVIFVPTMVIAVPHGGAIAAACVWALLNLLTLTIGAPILHRRILPGKLVPWALNDVLAPIAVVSVVDVAFRLLAPSQDAGRLVWLIYIAFVFGSIAIASVLASTILRSRVHRLAMRGPGIGGAVAEDIDDSGQMTNGR